MTRDCSMITVTFKAPSPWLLWAVAKACEFGFPADWAARLLVLGRVKAD
jgi:hypothetical protein